MKLPATLLALALLSANLTAETADQAWTKIQALQKGPGAPSSESPEEVVHAVRAHLLAQEKALAAFLHNFPTDPRRYDAELEYSAVLSTLGASLSDRARVEKSLQRLSALERSKTAPSKYRADAAFQRITTTMQTVNRAASIRPGETATARNTILESTQNFAATYPADRRAARLLTESAVLLDDQPTRKRKILEQAATLARDDATRQRIKDDLLRLELLGREPDVSFTDVQGREFSLAAQRGRVVILVFWAGWSPPSVAWLAEFGKFVRSLPSDRIAIATVSLDRKKENCTQTLRKLGLDAWPTAFSGSGWDDPLARRLGINALPTVFIFDRQGRLRTLNARQGYEPLIRQLLTER